MARIYEIIPRAAVDIYHHLLKLNGGVPTTLYEVKQLGPRLGLTLDPVDADDPRRPRIFAVDPNFGADLIKDTARGGGRIRWDAAMLPSAQAVFILHELAEFVASDDGQLGLFDGYQERYTFTGRGRRPSRRNTHHRTAIAVEDLWIADLRAIGISTRIMERARREHRSHATD